MNDRKFSQSLKFNTCEPDSSLSIDEQIKLLKRSDFKIIERKTIEYHRKSSKYDEGFEEEPWSNIEQLIESSTCGDFDDD